MRKEKAKNSDENFEEKKQGKGTYFAYEAKIIWTVWCWYRNSQTRGKDEKVQKQTYKQWKHYV